MALPNLAAWPYRPLVKQQQQDLMGGLWLPVGGEIPGGTPKQATAPATPPSKTAGSVDITTDLLTAANQGKRRTVTQQEYDATLAAYDAKYPDYKNYLQGPQERQNLMDSMLIAPGPPPDLSDELVRQKAQLARSRLLLGSGNAVLSSMNLSPGPTSAPQLTGS